MGRNFFKFTCGHYHLPIKRPSCTGYTHTVTQASLQPVCMLRVLVRPLEIVGSLQHQIRHISSKETIWITFSLYSEMRLVVLWGETRCTLRWDSLYSEVRLIVLWGETHCTLRWDSLYSEVRLIVLWGETYCTLRWDSLYSEVRLIPRFSPGSPTRESSVVCPV